MLSVLVPVYNEEECFLLLYERLSCVLSKLPCKSEILFVNDGSKDNSLLLMKEVQKKDKRVSLVDLSRNFGKEIAMAAGIDYIKGDALVIIDADLQDPPELILEMFKEIEQGYDDVYAKRSNRKGESFLKKATSKLYYRLLKTMSDIPIQEDTGDYRMFSKRAIDALRQLKENERNMKGLFSYIGLKKKPIYYERDARAAGCTKWRSLSSMVHDFFPSGLVFQNSFAYCVVNWRRSIFHGIRLFNNCCCTGCYLGRSCIRVSVINECYSFFRRNSVTRIRDYRRIFRYCLF